MIYGDAGKCKLFLLLKFFLSDEVLSDREFQYLMWNFSGYKDREIAALDGRNITNQAVQIVAGRALKKVKGKVETDANFREELKLNFC